MIIISVDKKASSTFFHLIEWKIQSIIIEIISIMKIFASHYENITHLNNFDWHHGNRSSLKEGPLS